MRRKPLFWTTKGSGLAGPPRRCGAWPRLDAASSAPGSCKASGPSARHDAVPENELLQCNEKSRKEGSSNGMPFKDLLWRRNHGPFLSASARRCGYYAVRCYAEAGAFSAQPLCTSSSGASRADPARAGCAVAFDMVDAHTGSPPCRKAVHNKGLRVAGCWNIGRCTPSVHCTQRNSVRILPEA